MRMIDADELIRRIRELCDSTSDDIAIVPEIAAIIRDMENTKIPNRLLTNEEYDALPVGTCVWSEGHNPDPDCSFPCAKRTKAASEGVGIACRMWLRKPTAEERAAVPWESEYHKEWWC